MEIDQFEVMPNGTIYCTCDQCGTKRVIEFWDGKTEALKESSLNATDVYELKGKVAADVEYVCPTCKHKMYAIATFPHLTMKDLYDDIRGTIR